MIFFSTIAIQITVQVMINPNKVVTPEQGEYKDRPDSKNNLSFIVLRSPSPYLPFAATEHFGQPAMPWPYPKVC